MALKSSTGKLYIFQYNLPSVMLPAVTQTYPLYLNTVPENNVLSEVKFRH